MSSTLPIHEPGPWMLPVKTSLGVFSAEFTARGLARLEFPREQSWQGRAVAPRIPAQVKRWWGLTERAVCAALSGAVPTQLPPFDWSAATAFQRKVWEGLQKIRTGRTVTYGELAQRLAQPRAARAVGAACGANPVPVLVPCHRVLAANGALGGFSAGLDWKRRLLAAERVQLAA